jgi:hypothetical protein
MVSREVIARTLTSMPSQTCVLITQYDDELSGLIAKEAASIVPLLGLNWV